MYNGKFVSIASSGFTVRHATRVTPSISSIIDIILTSFSERHIETGIVKVTLSDHYLVYTMIDLQRETRARAP